MKTIKNKKKKIEFVEDVPIKLDLACGDRKQEGFLGVDVEKTDSTDYVFNLLEFPWPFKDNSVDELTTSHFIEHIPMAYWNDNNRLSILPEKGSVELFEKFFEECWRVLKPGGKFTIEAPYYSSMRCWQDPTHRRAITDATFLYFIKEWREVNKLVHCHTKANFAIVNSGYNVDMAIASRNEEYRAMAFKNYINSINDIKITLQKVE